MTSKPVLPTLPADYYRTIPIDVYLRQGSEPLKSIHAAARSSVKIKSLLVRIAAQVKFLDAAGVAVADRRKLSASVSSIVCTRRPQLTSDGDEVEYPHCPSLSTQIVALPQTLVTPAILASSYKELAAACKVSIKIGERLDTAMRQEAEIPYVVDFEGVDIWTTISTGGVPGWTTKQFGELRSVEFDYLVYADA